jgi:hypothetical protein
VLKTSSRNFSLKTHEKGRNYHFCWYDILTINWKNLIVALFNYIYHPLKGINIADPESPQIYCFWSVGTPLGDR